MIPSATVVSFIFAAVCTVPVPIVLLIVLGVKRKIHGLPLLVGAAAFFISQIVLRIPLIGILSGQGWFQAFAAQYLPYVLVLSLSAGLFEESARLGGALLLKKNRSYKDIISFGLGHGLCEVVVLVGLSYVSNLFIALMINGTGEAAALMLPSGTLETVAAQLAAIRPIDVCWGILERVSAVIFHIFATMLVFTGVIQKKIRYYFLAVLAHTVFNLAGVLLARYVGTAVAEIAMLLMALCGGLYVLMQRKGSQLS